MSFTTGACAKSSSSSAFATFVSRARLLASRSTALLYDQSLESHRYRRSKSELPSSGIPVWLYAATLDGFARKLLVSKW
jgi:hypothetical protein